MAKYVVAKGKSFSVKNCIVKEGDAVQESMFGSKERFELFIEKGHIVEAKDDVKKSKAKTDNTGEGGETPDAVKLAGVALGEKNKALKAAKEALKAAKTEAEKNEAQANVNLATKDVEDATASLEAAKEAAKA